MGYKLLVFNEDFGDEHDVPALAVMTEEEYLEWYNTPSGTLNPKYDEELAEYNKKYSAFRDSRDRIEELGLSRTPVKDVPSDLIDEYMKLREVPCVSLWEKPDKVDSNMNAYLGNSGECFEEKYKNLCFMGEFVDANIVSVSDVSDNFALQFKKSGLDNLSLCNVFEINN